MHLSFQFQDFFHNRSASASDLTDVKTPTFLVHSGVVGDFKIKDLKESLINDENARIELNLEGTGCLTTSIADC